MPEQRELIIQALIRVYHGKFPSSEVCKQVALQQAEACLELICKDIMIDCQSREEQDYLCNDICVEYSHPAQ